MSSVVEQSTTNASSRPNNVAEGRLVEVRGSDGESKGKDANHVDSNNEKGKTYIYRDFGKLIENECDLDYEMEQEGLFHALEESTALAAAQTLTHVSPALAFLAPPPPPVLRATGWVRSQRFPVKLYALLSQPQLASIITRMPHGRSWKVLKPRVFEAAVLPIFFESDNYHSFNRVINAWSFRRKSTGPDRGSYFHELFLRGKPSLQRYMRRLPRTHKKLAMKKEEEPDFMELEKTSPLPTLVEAQATLELRKVKQLREQMQHGSATSVAQTLMLANVGIPPQRLPSL